MVTTGTKAWCGQPPSPRKNGGAGTRRPQRRVCPSVNGPSLQPRGKRAPSPGTHGVFGGKTNKNVLIKMSSSLNTICGYQTAISQFHWL